MTRLISALIVAIAALTFSSCGCKRPLNTPPLQPLPRFQDPRTLDIGDTMPQVEEVPLSEPVVVEPVVVDEK